MNVVFFGRDLFDLSIFSTDDQNTPLLLSSFLKLQKQFKLKETLHTLSSLPFALEKWGEKGAFALGNAIFFTQKEHWTIEALYRWISLLWNFQGALVHKAVNGQDGTNLQAMLTADINKPNLI